MIDFGTVETGWKPNTFLVAPAGVCKRARPDLKSPLWRVDAARLMAEIDAIFAAMERTRRTDISSDGLAVTYVQKTAGLGFPDIVSVQVFPMTDKSGKPASALGIFSRSRYGIVDFGVNRRRVNHVLNTLRSSLPTA